MGWAVSKYAMSVSAAIEGAKTDSESRASELLEVVARATEPPVAGVIEEVIDELRISSQSSTIIVRYINNEASAAIDRCLSLRRENSGTGSDCDWFLRASTNDSRGR